MDALKLKDLLLELIEELKIARITIAENEGRIQQLVKECHDKERKLEEEATKLQSLKDEHEETETILNKASDDKINHLEAEKTKLHLAGESLEKEMKTLKDEVRTLQISNYNLERTVREQQHRLATQGQNKTSHSEQVIDIENRCKHLQKEMTSYSDTLSILKKEVTEAGVLNRMLSSTNNHQKCEISSLRDEIERKQQDIIKLRVHVAERPDDAGHEKIELKITQLQKELKQEAHINQELKIQLGETKLAHQVTQTQLKESQDLAERCMTSSKELTKKVALQETQVAALTKECASLSEQRTDANTESSGLRKEMEEWEAKKRSEMLVLEEEAEKVKTECSNLKKAVLNLEDINASWASKNQAMTNDLQRIKIELDSQATELEKLKVPICKFDKDTQTLSSAGDDASRTDKEEFPANSACEKPMDVSAKEEQMQTEDREARDLQVANGVNRESSLVEGLTTWNLSSGEGDSGLHLAISLQCQPSGKDASSQRGKLDNSKDGDNAVQDEMEVDGHKTEEPSSEICQDHTSSSSSVKAVVKEATQKSKENRESKQVNVMDGQKPKEPSSESNRENSVEAMPMRLDTARKYMDDNGDSKQGVLTVQEDSHHQTLSTVDTVLSHDSVHLSDGMMMDPEKDAKTKVSGMSGQNANNLEFIFTKKSLNLMSENLEITTNANCPASSEASIVNQLLSPEISSSREAVMSLCKEDTLLPVQDIETSLEKPIHDETDVCASTALVAKSSGVAALSENLDKADISDEDIVIPSTYAEENSTCRGEEIVKVPECKTTSCDHDDSMAEELPVTTGISEDQMGFPVSSTSRGGLKNIFTEPAKTLPIAPERKTGDGKSDRTTKSSLTDTFQRSGDLSMSKERGDASKKNTVERRSISENADTEMVSLEKDSSQYIKRLRSFSYTDEEGVRLAATYLGLGLGSFNSSTRKEHCTSLTTETSYLQTPKRKCAPAFHHVTSPPLVLKTVTCLPDKTAPFSYLSNSEPLTVSSINTLQKPSSLAKTKFTSPIMMKGLELRNAASYASRKTPELQLHTQQQQEGKVMIQTPAMFSRLPSSAQQLHQTLYPLTPSAASQKIQSVHPSSTSISSLSEQSIDPPRTHPQWQESAPKTSYITTANETHRVMPRLTHGRTFLEQSSDKDDQEKTSSKTTSVPDSTVTSPKHPAVSINLKCWLPPGMDQTDPGEMHGGGGDADGEVSLFSDEEADEDMKDGVASQIDRIQSFLKKDRLKRAKLE